MFYHILMKWHLTKISVVKFFESQNVPKCPKLPHCPHASSIWRKHLPSCSFVVTLSKSSAMFVSLSRIDCWKYTQKCYWLEMHGGLKDPDYKSMASLYYIRKDTSLPNNCTLGQKDMASNKVQFEKKKRLKISLIFFELVHDSLK